MEELKYNISYASRKDLINFDNDAASCYNRIILGKVSNNSPTIGLFISSTLFDAHEFQAHGAMFMSPDQQISMKLTMVEFVDDATGQALYHYKAPSGTHSTQAAVLQTKADGYALCIMLSPLNPFKAQSFYKSIFQKALSYILGQSCVTSKQLLKTEQKAQCAFATKCKFNRNMKYYIWDGPEELGGADFFSLVHIQGICQGQGFHLSGSISN
eukprot:15345066-Ditylum_brightwellii.AAC.1